MALRPITLSGLMALSLAVLSGGCTEFPGKLTQDQVQAQLFQDTFDPGTNLDGAGGDSVVVGDGATPGGGADLVDGPEVAKTPGSCQLGLLDDDFSTDHGWRILGSGLTLDFDNGWLDVATLDQEHAAALLNAAPWEGEFELRLDMQVDALKTGAVASVHVGDELSASALDATRIITIERASGVVRLTLEGLDPTSHFIQAKLGNVLGLTIRRNHSTLSVSVTVGDQEPVLLETGASSQASSGIALHFSGRVQGRVFQVGFDPCPTVEDFADFCAEPCAGAQVSCVRSVCNPLVGCVDAPAVVDSVCDDGDACTVDDTCADAGCIGVAIGCDDGNQCTKDSCDPGSGCVFAALDGGCDDDNPCTFDDVCESGSCFGQSMTCDDPPEVQCASGTSLVLFGSSGICGEGKCSYADTTIDCPKGCVDGVCKSDQCDGEADGTECSDGDACTVADQCKAGECVGKSQVCDDGNPCTDDYCHPATGCATAPAAGACDDGDACTQGDACSGGTCLPGGPLACNDANPCTANQCDPSSGCAATPVEGVCDDGNACTVGDACLAGTCKPGAGPDCDDGNPCTDDSCSEAMGCTHTATSGSCDDGDACTAGDLCVGGSCAPGAPIGCDDDNVCTVDTCHADVGCSYVGTAGPCEDGNACTQGDLCSDGQCVPGPGPDCDDGNPCTKDGCSVDSGCTNTAQSVACDDGDACTEGDVCFAGSCVSGPALTCDDDTVCTADSCDPATGCVAVAADADCDDGNACTVGDACIDGACAAGVGPDCDDNNPCTDDTCSIESGCGHSANALACDDGDACTSGDTCFAGDCIPGPGTGCDDDNICTTNSCDPASGCTYAAVVIPCDDGDACTAGDQCSGGACQPGNALDCGDDNVCTDDSCDASVGCVNSANSVACSDNDACTAGDVCMGGSCASGTSVVCDDDEVCTADTCFAATGCQYSPSTGPCDDGSACTTGDACQAGACSAGAKEQCDDGNACTDDSCSPSLGCLNTPNSASCDDGDDCTQNDACAVGSCFPGVALNCDDGNPCTDDSCGPDGCVNIAIADGSSCDDGLICTDSDVCTAGVCGGADVVCDDGDDCTYDVCDPAGGCIFQVLADGVACEDGAVCSDATCQSGQCVGAPAVCNTPPAEFCSDATTKMGYGPQGVCNAATDQCEYPLEERWCVGPCDAGVCEWTSCLWRPETTTCSDGDLCTTNGHCSWASCVSEAIDCDDGDPFTVDSCDTKDGCVHVYDTNLASCDDGNDCTLEGWDDQAGQCTYANNDLGVCDLAAACGQGVCDQDQCLPGVCPTSAFPLLPRMLHREADAKRYYVGSDDGTGDLDKVNDYDTGSWKDVELDHSEHGYKLWFEGIEEPGTVSGVQVALQVRREETANVGELWIEVYQNNVALVSGFIDATSLPKQKSNPVWVTLDIPVDGADASVMGQLSIKVWGTNGAANKDVRMSHAELWGNLSAGGDAQ